MGDPRQHLPFVFPLGSECLKDRHKRNIVTNKKPGKIGPDLCPSGLFDVKLIDEFAYCFYGRTVEAEPTSTLRVTALSPRCAVMR